MRLYPIDRTAVLVVAAGLALAACGEEEPALIPPEDSAVLQDLLERAQDEFDDGSCEELDGTLGKLDRAADQLPDAEVSRQIRTRLNDEIVDLNGLADQCRPAVEPAPEPTPVVPTTPPPPTTAPVPPPTVPVEPTTPEETQPETDTGETTDEDPPSKEQDSSGPSQGNSDSGSESGNSSKPTKPTEDPCEGSNSPRC